MWAEEVGRKEGQNDDFLISRFSKRVEDSAILLASNSEDMVGGQN